MCDLQLCVLLEFLIVVDRIYYNKCVVICPVAHRQFVLWPALFCNSVYSNV